MRLFALAIAAGLLAGPAAAQDAELRKDARCLVVAGALGQDAKLAEASRLMGVYFLGRIDARGGGGLEPLVIGEIKTMSRDALAAESKRCGDIMRSRGEALKALGGAIRAAQPKTPA